MIGLTFMFSVVCITSCTNSSSPKCSSYAGVVGFCDSVTPSRVFLKPHDVKTLIAQEAFGNVDYIPLRVKIEISDTIRYIVTFQRVKQFTN